MSKVIKRVPIAKVGDFNLFKGGWTQFTEKHLAAAAKAASEDKAVRTPRVKLGHVDPRFDGQPAFGRWENLDFVESDETLYADAVLPDWLAKDWDLYYPNRSLEGRFDATTSTGAEWDFVVDRVVLLGEQSPGIDTLEDVHELMQRDAELEGAGLPVAASVYIDGKNTQDGAVVMAATSVDRINTAFYEWSKVNRPATNSDGICAAYSNCWIKEVQLDPRQLIFTDDTMQGGKLFRLPYSLNSDGTVSFGEPKQVQVEYTDVPQSTAARAAYVYASADETKPKESQVDMKALAKRLGLPEDATEETINKALDDKLKAEGQPTKPEPGQPQEPNKNDPRPEPGQKPGEEGNDGGTNEPPADGTLKVPAGFKLIDEATLEGLKSGVKEAGELVAASKAQAVDVILLDAMKQGKFAPAQKDTFRRLLVENLETGKAVLASLAEDVIPVTERGTGAGDSAEVGAGMGNGDEYDPQWLTPQERARIEAAHKGEDTRPLIQTESQKAQVA